MSIDLAFGFAGDSLSFLGGVVLAFDAIVEERRLKRIRDWQRMIKEPELAGVVLTRGGVMLKSKEDVEISFVRQSAKRAVVGAIILTIGFACLFVSRVLESRSEHPVAIGRPLDMGHRNIG